MHALPDACLLSSVLRAVSIPSSRDAKHTPLIKDTMPLVNVIPVLLFWFLFLFLFWPGRSHFFYPLSFVSILTLSLNRAF